MRKEKKRRTFRADRICSGNIVFFESFSHISFASDAIANTNSRMEEEVHQQELKGNRYQDRKLIPLQHSVIKSLTSFEQVKFFGINSKLSA